MPKKRVSFFTHTKLDPVTGCWNWLGAKYRDGYGEIWYKGRMEATHRVAAVLWLGFKLDSKLWVLHKCDNKACCNPKHLFFGNHSDNMRDAVAKGLQGMVKKTHCPYGHEYNTENTYRVPGKVNRFCIKCRDRRLIEFKERKQNFKATQP